MKKPCRNFALAWISNVPAARACTRLSRRLRPTAACSTRMRCASRSRAVMRVVFRFGSGFHPRCPKRARGCRPLTRSSGSIAMRIPLNRKRAPNADALAVRGPDSISRGDGTLRYRPCYSTCRRGRLAAHASIKRSTFDPNAQGDQRHKKRGPLPGGNATRPAGCSATAVRFGVLDEKLSAIIRGLVGVERRRRITAIAVAIGVVRDEFTRRNALANGRLPVEIEKVCAAELEHRAKTWLSISRRAFEESFTRWTAASADTLRQLLRAEIRSDWDALLETYREAVTPHGHDGSRRFGALDEAQGRIETELPNELQLLVLGEDRSRVPVTEQLMTPRYVAVRASWDRATSNARTTGDERVQAIRDAIGAVEQLARIVTDAPTKTLGACLDLLKRSRRVEEPLLR